ncbi:CdiI family contact-dependent growth inhibition immunity protein [Herbaspirillum seropedicae]|uniref:DUF1436 family protein n=1 Tax=Herbaspirillum seropedicae (strain SmR1) TaxID=757424 RepID=D8IY27_HERSS|nr:contact-dependent growth inhibition system immunity protein [Herbaspirillum seropedicae]ADJ66149.1 hypothetical protein Hsero_4683 [Herbaspirillum seropedicae SmR1]MDR6397834.1 hypothetical protein [Herbaspirillum seropedicae]UMU23944.1 CdiI family contact-dependent growth inhibition immunity protein [Herbaspirillum seropedicae]
MEDAFRATVYFNGDLYQIITMAQGMLDFADPDLSPQILMPTTTDAELGGALRLALSKSRQVTVPEFQEILKSGIVQKNAKERQALIMQRHGYKNRKAMMRKMACCWITADKAKIEIKPTHHKNIDGYSGISNDGPEIIFISTNSGDAELGAALKEGFSRCTSAVP